MILIDGFRYLSKNLLVSEKISSWSSVHLQINVSLKFIFIHIDRVNVVILNVVQFTNI